MFWFPDGSILRGAAKSEPAGHPVQKPTRKQGRFAQHGVRRAVGVAFKQDLLRAAPIYLRKSSAFPSAEKKIAALPPRRQSRNIVGNSGKAKLFRK